MKTVDVFGYDLGDGSMESRTFHILPAHVAFVSASGRAGRTDIILVGGRTIRTEQSVDMVFKKLRKASGLFGRRVSAYIGIAVGCACAFIVLAIVMGALFGG